MSASRVMIVTASQHQGPLVRKAKALGCEVLVTDVRSDAPALALADRAVVADARSREDILRVASEFRPQAILSEQTDIAVPAVAFVAERLGLPGIGYEAAVRATDKWHMREACRMAGIPTPQYRLATSIEAAIDAARDIGVPVVVKPTDSQSSRGVTKVTDPAAVPAAAEVALAASASGRILVEERMLGGESSIESFVIGDTVHVLGICDKIKCRPPYSFDLQLIYPAAFPSHVVDEIRELNSKVIRAIGIRMGFTHAEMMITAHGVRLIEIAARGCGARVATDLLPELTGIDLLAMRLRQALGEPVEIANIRADRCGILRFFELPLGTIRRISGLQEAAAVPGVIHLEFARTVGWRLLPAIDGDYRPGFVLAVAPDRAQAIAIADQVTSLVAVEVV
jgi:biotin carboxylase